jgi:hypothetical protein
VAEAVDLHTSIGGHVSCWSKPEILPTDVLRGKNGKNVAGNFFLEESNGRSVTASRGVEQKIMVIALIYYWHLRSR